MSLQLEAKERFSKPNIRFGSGRTGSKIVSKFRLTHNRKLRSANRNTIYHTIACPALLLWCLAAENRVPCVPKKCSSSNCASPGDSFCQVLDHWWYSKKVHRQPSWMEASIWPCYTSDKSSEVSGMVWTWRGYERNCRILVPDKGATGLQ